MSVKTMFVDDIKSGEEINHDKLMELLSKAPKREFGGRLVILQGGTYSTEEMKSLREDKNDKTRT